MKYTAAALALAGAVLAQEAESTVYSTQFFTVTSCAPEVGTKCPASSTVVHSSIVPMTTSTIYTTKISTVTSCAPEVGTKCPAGSTVVVTETEAVSTTVCPVTETGVKPSATAPVATPPAHETKSQGVPPAVPTKSEGVPPAVPTTEAATKPVPVTTGGVVPSVSKPATLISSPAPECSGVSVKTISTSVTTVIPTVIYETVGVPCSTASKPSATIPGTPTGGNGTAVPPTKTPITAGASGLSGSVVLAAVAGVAAYVFA